MRDSNTNVATIGGASLLGGAIVNASGCSMWAGVGLGFALGLMTVCLAYKEQRVAELECELKQAPSEAQKPAVPNGGRESGTESGASA